jgi:translation initiation factor 1
MALRVVLRYESKSRGGKPVTLVSGLAPLGDAKIAALATELKKRCACGGSVQPGGTILIQGDHRDTIHADLEARGWTVTRSGG